MGRICTFGSFDCRNSRGKSFNNQQYATLTDFCDDLRCVINWAKYEDFYTTPFLLAGHSSGGTTVLDYAINNSEQISGIILISSVFSGNDLLKNTKAFAPEFLQLLKDGGIICTRSAFYLQKTCFERKKHWLRIERDVLLHGKFGVRQPFK